MKHTVIRLDYLAHNGETRTGVVTSSDIGWTSARGIELLTGRPLLLRWDVEYMTWREVIEYSYTMAIEKHMYPEIKLLFEQRAHAHLDRDRELLDGREPLQRGQRWYENPAFPGSILLEVWALL